MKTLFKVCQLAIVLALGIGAAFGQYTWTKDARNPVFTGVSGTWSTHVFCPCVLFNSDSARYEMWFNATIGLSAHPNYRPYSVGRAISNDGINWTMDPSPVLSPDAGQWDAVTIDVPRVIRENGQYKMWYSSWKDDISPQYLGYATSSDGIHWAKYSGNPIFGPGTAAWEAGGPWGVSIIPFQRGYKMWYTGYTVDFETTAIGYATSADGINWERDSVNSPVLDAGARYQWDDSDVWAPSVLPIGDSWYMWYVGNSTSTGLAVSENGRTNWTKYPSNPVLVPGGGGTWDAERTTVGTVLRVRDTLHMWYDGWRTPHSSYQYRIGHATAHYDLWVTLVAPEDNAILRSNSYRFFWNQTVTAAVKYRLQLATDSLFSQIVIDDSTLTDTSYAAGGLTDGNYYWRACARDLNGWGIYGDVRRLTILVSVASDDFGAPRKYTLEQNYPNPFNPTTVIKYTVGGNRGWGLGVRDVSLVAYDILGREVAVLVNEKKAPGNYTVRFDGSGLSNGVYFYRLTAGQFVQTRKMILMK